MRKFGLKLKKVVGACLALSMIIGVGVSDTYAATKSKSWLSSDGKTLYRATSTTTTVADNVIAISGWTKHVKGRDEKSVTFTKSKTQSCEVSSKFGGEFSVELAKISAELGASVTKGVTFTYSQTATIKENAATGYYRAIICFPRYKVHGVVTKEPNGDGNHQIMERLNKKTVVTDQTIQYAPDKNKAYDDFQYSANI